jgi:long-chain acyl-CoA synthetase
MGATLTIAYYIKTLAEQYEDRPAIYFKSAFRTFAFTYRQMHERCLRVANYLSQRKIKKGDRIIVWTYNGQGYASILLGCALSGVVAVPVDFSSNADLVEIIAGKVGAKHLFHSKRRPFPSQKLSHIHVEDLEGELLEVPITQRDFGVSDDDIYEIVYTSGTTSEPKGVIITNKNIVSNVMHCNEVMPLRKHHTFLSVLPMSHMFEQAAGFFYPLYYGCTITYLYSRKSSTIIEAMQRERVTMMVTVPIFLQALRENILRQVRARGKEAFFSRMFSAASHSPRSLRRLFFHKVHQKFGGRLERFIVGGSALAPNIEAWWTALGFDLFQGYGLTEASPVVTLNTPSHGKQGSVGRCLPNQQIKLGPENEIWISGDNITPGYYSNPRENAARFEDGWYKTGDIGEFDEDGFLYIRGRKKNMIKSASGLNIYPEDIEAVLNKIPEIKDTCVIGLDAADDIQIHAVLLMDKSRQWTTETARPIIASANQRLQPHQHIQGYTIWPHDDFPRTNTRKIKRAPVIDEIQNRKSSGALIPPSSGDRILDLIAASAKVDVGKIKPDSNLVSDLGLDSIARVELAMMLEEDFSVEIDESAITPETTVSQLREIVTAQQKESLYYDFPRWAVTLPARILRVLLQAVLFRLPSLFSRTTVKGRENLRDINEPVIFIANHICHYDTIYIARAIPRRLRKLAIAAAADIVYEIKPDFPWIMRLRTRLRRFALSLMLNTFPFSREAHVKKSFEYMGGLIDDGWNILLFPEGKLSTTGLMDQFKPGIGLLTQAMQAPVVPVRIDDLYQIVDYQRWLPKRFGRVRLTFGRPIQIDRQAPPEKLAHRFENAIKHLR